MNPVRSVRPYDVQHGLTEGVCPIPCGTFYQRRDRHSASEEEHFILTRGDGRWHSIWDHRVVPFSNRCLLCCVIVAAAQ